MEMLFDLFNIQLSECAIEEYREAVKQVLVWIEKHTNHSVGDLKIFMTDDLDKVVRRYDENYRGTRMSGENEATPVGRYMNIDGERIIVLRISDTTVTNVQLVVAHELAHSIYNELPVTFVKSWNELGETAQWLICYYREMIHEYIAASVTNECILNFKDFVEKTQLSDYLINLVSSYKTGALSPPNKTEDAGDLIMILSRFLALDRLEFLNEVMEEIIIKQKLTSTIIVNRCLENFKNKYEFVKTNKGLLISEDDVDLAKELFLSFGLDEITSFLN